MKKALLVLLLLVLAAGAAWKGVSYYRDNCGFTPWMDYSKMAVFFEERGVKDAQGKNFWDRRHWLAAVEGRWRKGKPEYRYRVEDAPAKGPYWWWWWYNQDLESFNKHLIEMGDQYCTLVYMNSFKLPDGTIRYSGVWHRTIPGPKDASTKQEEKSFDEKVKQALEDAKAAVVMAAEAEDLDATRAELHGLLARVYDEAATPQRQALRERLQAAVFYIPRWQEYLAARDAGNPMAFQYLHNLAMSTSTFAPFPTSALLEWAEKERPSARK